MLDGLDGLILTGGKDVDPARYGQEPHAETDEPRPDRDAWEVALLRRGDRARHPVPRHLPRPAAAERRARRHAASSTCPRSLGTERYSLGGGVFATNEVHVEAGIELAARSSASGSSARATTTRAIDRSATGLVVTARSDDGVIQAVELPEPPVRHRVQWHPEQDAARTPGSSRDSSTRHGAMPTSMTGSDA